MVNVDKLVKFISTSPIKILCCTLCSDYQSGDYQVLPCRVTQPFVGVTKIRVKTDFWKIVHTFYYTVSILVTTFSFIKLTMIMMYYLLHTLVL